MRPFDQLFEFAIVDAGERHGVDLDGDAGRLRSIDAGEHFVDVTQRVTALNFCGSSVSSETLMRLTHTARVHRRSGEL